MLCESVRLRLSALVDQELSPLEGWLLRRHLRHCDACTNIFLDIESISKAGGSLHCNAPLPDKFHARFAAEAEKREAAVESGIRPHARRIRKSLLLGPMVAIGIAACCAVGWVFYLKKVQSRVDFADIAQSTQSFHTAHIHKTTISGNPTTVLEEDVWANMDIPAIVFSEHLPDGKEWRTTFSHATIDRRPPGMQSALKPPASWKNDQNWAQSLRKNITRIFVIPPGGNIATTTDTSRTNRYFSAFDPTSGWRWTPAKRIHLNGRSLLRLNGTKRHVKAVLFADPKTFRIVRFEQHWSNYYLRGKMDMVMDYNGYDEAISGGVFTDAHR